MRCNLKSTSFCGADQVGVDEKFPFNYNMLADENSIRYDCCQKFNLNLPYFGHRAGRYRRFSHRISEDQHMGKVDSASPRGSNTASFLS
jgi:hypothetical protein